MRKWFAAVFIITALLLPGALQADQSTYGKLTRLIKRLPNGDELNLYRILSQGDHIDENKPGTENESGLHTLRYSLVLHKAEQKSDELIWSSELTYSRKHKIPEKMEITVCNNIEVLMKLLDANIDGDTASIMFTSYGYVMKETLEKKDNSWNRIKSDIIIGFRDVCYNNYFEIPNEPVILRGNACKHKYAVMGRMLPDDEYQFTFSNGTVEYWQIKNSKHTLIKWYPESRVPNITTYDS